MTGTPDDTETDRRIDGLIRAASDRPTDEAALSRAVLSRLAANNRTRRVWGLPSLRPATTIAGFAALLAASGVAGYGLSGQIAEGDILLTMAFGDPDVLFAGLGLGGQP